MTRDDIKNSIAFLFEVVEGDFYPADREAKLRLALDRLALAIHFAEFTFDEADYPETPIREYNLVRDLVSSNFPDLGYYNVAHDIAENIGEGSADVGDAIDDICDITSDLEQVLWRWQNTSTDDALWHFRNSFESHWGKHLRDLQLYLYAKDHGW
jgi:hypothetical protein